MRTQSAEPRRLYRQIADRVRTLIAQGIAGPGERLPAERELARRLRVSRPSVREAIIALEVEGLLEVRTGSGIYVSRAGGARRRAVSPGGDVGPFDVLHARRVVEGECAALAARNASPKQVKAIREAFARVVKASRRRPNPLDVDRAFHLRIAEASGNGALVPVVELLWEQRTGMLFSRLEDHYFASSGMTAQTLREHRAIVTAIARGDARAARAAMQRHMDETHRRYSRG